MSEDTKGIFAEFLIEPVEIPFKSAQEGRPIFEDREFVRIVIAGDKNTEVFRQVTDADKDRFHEVYERFQRGLKGREQLVGTPLREWAALRPAQVRELEAIDILTVEALADVSDTVKQRIGMGSHDLVAKARAFIAAAKDSGAAERYAAEVEGLRADNEALREQIKELAGRLETATERRGPGRPPKEARPSVGD